ncbi:MAG: FtsX-like permease family protein, partial [Lachnospiraceae bacterium]
MKVTSQLALSQIKLNRKRTLGTVFAISLSTSLVTAVMCFATSGNKMLTDFLGPDYGNYGGTYSLIIAVPALILGLLISFMSVTVISNIFAASANKRIQEFGILKCVGGTRKQIKETVIYES